MGARPQFARFSMAFSALLLLAASCSNRSSDEDTSKIPSFSSPQQGAPTGTLPELPGRLAVLTESGTLATMRPDGTDVKPLGEGRDPGLQASQPTWSPDGTHIAWIETGPELSGANIVTSRSDGSDLKVAHVNAGVFYLYWDPMSSRIAYLGNVPGGQETIQFGVVTEGTRAQVLDTGQPYYFSWSPSGGQFLVHAGEQLRVINLSGHGRSIAKPGEFQAPIWSGPTKFFVLEGNGCHGQCLVITSVGRAQAFTRSLRGGVRFVVSGDMLIAFQTTESGSGAAPDFGSLKVFQPSSRLTPSKVTDEPAIAFFWGPRNDLLYLTPEISGTDAWMHWNVWNGNESFQLPRILLSPAYFQGYVPFFDQYAQSMTLWSPDGAAFAYPGRNEAGDQGIWIQQARKGVDPVRIAAGEVVAWSPA
ncbi:MAG: hypothetical protein WD757_05400 [Actinomycetota bacterium]